MNEKNTKAAESRKKYDAEIEAGKFEIEEGIEDVHSEVELLLTQRLGDVGKKIHSGRSRNDQVLVDLRGVVHNGCAIALSLEVSVIHSR